MAINAPINDDIKCPHEIAATVDVSLASAFANSRLLECLLDFQDSGFFVESSSDNVIQLNSDKRAQAMLNVLNATENFSSLLSTDITSKRMALQSFNLGHLLSKRYWHSLLLSNQHPQEGKKELDDICTKLINATQLLSLDSPKNTKAISNRNHHVEKSSEPTVSISIVASVGVASGASALLLLWLFIGAFLPELPQQLAIYISAGSIPYRLIMILVLLCWIISLFILINVLTAKRMKATSPYENVQSRNGFLNNLLSTDASIGRILVGALGPLLLGLGSGISVSAGFGIFGFTVLLDGLSNTFQIPMWLSQSAITIACYLLAWFWGRIPLGLGTVTTLLLIGPAISFGASVTPEGLGFFGNMIAFIFGLFLFAFGITAAAAAALGPDGVTALSLAAERRHRWPVPRATFLWNFTAILAGVILGGKFGIATVIALFTVPYLIHLFMPPLRRAMYQKQ